MSCNRSGMESLFKTANTNNYCGFMVTSLTLNIARKTYLVYTVEGSHCSH